MRFGCLDVPPWLGRVRGNFWRSTFDAKCFCQKSGLYRLAGLAFHMSAGRGQPANCQEWLLSRGPKCSLARQPELLDLVLAHAPVAVMLSFGDPAPFARAIRQAGCALICQVQSVARARQALAAGAEVVVAQGTEAGGHGGARATLTLTPEIADLLAHESPDTSGPIRWPLSTRSGHRTGAGIRAARYLASTGLQQLAVVQARLDLHRGGLASDKNYAIRHVVDLDTHRHALCQPHPGEDRVHLR
jgi:hypothetical protein